MKRNSLKHFSRLFLFVLMAALALCFVSCGGDEASGEAVTFTLTVVGPDGTATDHTITSDAANLGDALLECGEMGVVGEDGAYGLYIKEVDGEKASDDDHTFWSIALNGEDLMVGADSQPINDGESYTLTLATW